MNPDIISTKAYTGNTRPNGIIDNTLTFNYKMAREYWNKMIRKDINMHRDDTCVKDLPLGDVKL